MSEQATATEDQAPRLPATPPAEHLPARFLAGASPKELTFDQMLKRAEVLAKTALVPKPLQGKPEAIVLVGALGAELGVPFIQALQEVHVIEGRPSPSAQLRLALIRRAGHEARFVASTTQRAVIRGRRRENRRDDDAWVEVEWTIEDARRAGLVDRWVERWVSKRGNDGNNRNVKETEVVGDDTGIFTDDERKKRALPSIPDWARVLLEAGDVKSKDNWMKYPAEMLRARASSALCRMEFSDVLAGLGVDPYTPEEQGIDIGQDVDEPAPEPSREPEVDDDVEDAELVDEEPAETEPDAAGSQMFPAGNKS